MEEIEIKEILDRVQRKKAEKRRRKIERKSKEQRRNYRK